MKPDASATSPEPADADSKSVYSDLVDIPHTQRHDSGQHVSLPGILVALVVAVFGGAVLGAGYGAFQALCGEHLANFALFCSIPFWLNAPAEVGFVLGNLREPRWRLRIQIVGLAVCLYAVLVGWLFAVLDGPGFVLNPIQLLGHLFDSTNHGVWVEAIPFIDLRPELQNLEPYLILLRVVEFSWLSFVGLMTLGGDSSFPYCQTCKCWMSDAETARLHYDVVDAKEVRALATDLVAGEYAGLLALSDSVKPREKGLDVKVFSCPKCKVAHVLDVRWFRTAPDPERTATEQLLDSTAGIQVVSHLKVTEEIPAHISTVANRKAA